MSLIAGSPFQGDQAKPLVAGHRGFRGKFPENTLLAMRQGVAAGACIIETDIQLASDGIVVMCHDVDTGRCFNEKHYVEHTPYYGTLENLHTKDQYKERMPTLKETAEMFAHDPAFANVRLMIDIKRSNGPHVVPYVVKVLESVAPLDVWETKCTFGVWREDVLESVEQHASAIPVTFIGIEHRLARRFMKSPQLEAISIAYASLVCSGGSELMQLARTKGLDIYAWTVNDPDAMKWAVAARVKGVVTDYPDVFHHFLSQISDKDLMSEYFTSEPQKFFSLAKMLQMYTIYVMATCYLALANNIPWMFAGF